MVLSPLDIRNKTFSTKMRGFSQEEVDDFLDQVINDYEGILNQNRDLEKHVKHLEEKLRYFNELKEALNQSIIVAQETADQVKESAQKEAEAIIADARLEANQVLEDATTKATDMVQDAKERSTTMVKDATERANFLINDATAKANSLASETDDLKKKTRTFHQRLTLLLESQLEIVKSDEWEDLLKPFSAYITEGHQTFRNAVDMNKLEEPNIQKKVEKQEAPELPSRNITKEEKKEAAPKTEEKAKAPVTGTRVARTEKAVDTPKQEDPQPSLMQQQSANHDEFLGQTMALDRSQLNEQMTRQTRRSRNQNLDFQETTAIELPKLRRRSDLSE